MDDLRHDIDNICLLAENSTPVFRVSNEWSYPLRGFPPNHLPREVPLPCALPDRNADNHRTHFCLSSYPSAFISSASP
jgi:hypothetical protein